MHFCSRAVLHARLLMRKHHGSVFRGMFTIADPSQALSQAPIQMRNRPNLPDSEYEHFPDYIVPKVKNYMAAYSFQGSAKNFETIGKELRRVIDAKLESYGALFFRGIPIETAQDFSAMMKATNLPLRDYASGTAIRSKVADDVYEASREPQEYSIELHNEMSYSPVCNDKQVMCCLQPACVGGQTVICSNDEAPLDVDQFFIDKVRRKKINYVRNVGATDDHYLSWSSVFETDDKKEVESFLKLRNLQWEWKENGDLSFWCTLNPYIADPNKPGKEIWFNQISGHHESYFKGHAKFAPHYNLDKIASPTHTTYGDGEEFEDEFIKQVRASNWRYATALELRKGDVVVLDNLRVQHGRMDFQAPREIVVALSGRYDVTRSKYV